jgi:hypothetical protein
MKSFMTSEIEKRSGELVIGWVCQPWRESAGEALADATARAAERFRRRMQDQFPHYDWRCEVRVRRPRPVEPGRIDPLDFLALGCGEKLARRWDYALVVTDAELLARTRPFTIGVPSSALETAVLSTCRFPRDEEDPCPRLIAMGLYFFGHMLGLSPHAPGAMTRPLEDQEVLIEDYDKDDQQRMEDRLEEVADLRLEEEGRKPGPLRSFLADPHGILVDAMGYQPWLHPFRLGGLTAAAFISMLLLFLGAESWELGVGFDGRLLAAGALSAIGVGAAFLYRGQNLHELTRQALLSEQLARSRLVLQLTLLAGMITLWSVLFAASLLLGWSFPNAVIEGWVGKPVGLLELARFSAFTATLGTLAGALGGNLEDEGAFKCKLLIDEEF